MNIPYSDIKHCLFREFDFLKAYGFSDFEEEQIAYEVHFTCANDNGIHIDVYFETISSTAINILINGTHFHEISDHEDILAYYRQLAALYDENFKSYLETNDGKYMHTNFDLYLSHGRSLNEKFLQSASTILNSDPVYLRDPAFYLDIISQRQPAVRLYGNDLQTVSPEEFQNKPDDPAFMKNFEDHWLFIETDKVEIDIYSPEEFIHLIRSGDLGGANLTGIRYQFIKIQS